MSQGGVGEGSGVEVSVDVGTGVFGDVGARVDVFVGGWVDVGVGDGAREPHEVMQRHTTITRGRVDLHFLMMDFLPYQAY